jgi:hypothetical protein
MALFTKYDQFKRNIKMELNDPSVHDPPIMDPDTHIDGKVKSVFKQHYIAHLREHATLYMCLESEEFVTDCPIILLISVLQICTWKANNVPILLT